MAAEPTAAPRDTPPTTTTRKVLMALPALALLGVAVWSLFQQRLEAARAPTDAEWTAAQTVVREGFREGDILRTAPHWADSARATMYEYPFNVARELEEEELYFYARLWLLADEEHVDDALASLPEGWTVEQRWDSSARTRVVLVDIPPAEHVLLDVVSDLDRALVERDYGDHREPCTVHHNGGWHCGSVDPWLHVTPSVEEIGNSLRRCLYVGIPPAELRVTWPDIALGSRIAGAIGNTMPAIRAERGSDVELRIEVDGETLYRDRFGKWDQDLQEFSVDTRALGGLHDLTFAIRADDFFDRWVCLRGRVLR